MRRGVEGSVDNDVWSSAMSARRAVLAGLVATTLTGGVTVALPVLANSGASTHAAFSRPMVLAGGGAEPSIRVPADHKSVAYVSAPTGLGSNFWRITEKRRANGDVTYMQSPVQQPDLGTGGGDSEISVGDLTQDAPANGCLPIAYSGLHNIDLLDNFTVATSTNCGKSFVLANPFATQNTLTDRQWQVFDGAHTNFLIYHLVSTGQIVVSVSKDDGQHYVSLGASNANGIIDPQLLAGSGTTQQIGNIIVNHAEPIKGATNIVSGEPVHAMYAIFGIADDAGTGAESNVPGGDYNGLDSIYVGKSVDGGVTWQDSKVFNVNPATHRELNMLFPVITADSAGNLYAAWADTYKVEYSVSTDHGAHWSKPFQVNRDNRRVAGNGADKPDPGKADVFPWIGAGGKGLLDVVWYHGDGGAPNSNRVYRDPGDAKTKWTVAFAQLRNADRVHSSVPTPSHLDYNQAITPVMHIGDICQNGTFCALVPVPGAPYSTGDRSLLDFFQVAIDREGRANLAIADNVDAPGQLIPAFTQQLTGYSVTTGRPLKPLHLKQPKLSCDGYGTFTDPPGDATEVGVVAASPSQDGLDLRRGWVTWDGKKRIAGFHLQVTDLKQLPQGATGWVFRFNFGWATKGYVLQATRDLSGATSYSMAESTSVGTTTIYTGLKGAFEDAHNEVRIDVPADVFGKVTDKAAAGPSLHEGAQITGLAAESRRDYPAALAPVADSAAGVCPATLTTVDGGAPTGGMTGFLPAAPKLPTDAGRLAAGLAIAVAAGAGAAWTVGRRSRLVAV
ncbi:MAG TPA: hypothetical protein VH274_01625 [Mycobacteriales bacterium]|nr:hypothetical protein [Mycobacteriales bacterium]